MCGAKSIQSFLNKILKFCKSETITNIYVPFNCLKLMFLLQRMFLDYTLLSLILILSKTFSRLKIAFAESLSNYL